MTTSTLSDYLTDSKNKDDAKHNPDATVRISTLRDAICARIRNLHSLYDENPSLRTHAVNNELDETNAILNITVTEKRRKFFLILWNRLAQWRRYDTLNFLELYVLLPACVKKNPSMAHDVESVSVRIINFKYLSIALFYSKFAVKSSCLFWVDIMEDAVRRGELWMINLLYTIGAPLHYTSISQILLEMMAKTAPNVPYTSLKHNQKQCLTKIIYNFSNNYNALSPTVGQNPIFNQYKKNFCEFLSQFVPDAYETHNTYMADLLLWVLGGRVWDEKSR